MKFRKELLQIDGISSETANDLIEKGFDTLEKLAGAKGPQLEAIKGLSAETIPGVLEQAGKMLEMKQAEDATLTELSEGAARLKSEVERLVQNLRERFSDANVPKEQLKELRRETSRTLASLEKVESALTDQLRRLSKGLARADRKISQLSERDIEEVVSGLRKARKKLDGTVD
jgi:chromosome segregation ATPase